MRFPFYRPFVFMVFVLLLCSFGVRFPPYYSVRFRSRLPSLCSVRFRPRLSFHGSFLRPRVPSHCSVRFFPAPSFLFFLIRSSPFRDKTGRRAENPRGGRFLIAAGLLPAVFSDPVPLFRFPVPIYCSLFSAFLPQAFRCPAESFRPLPVNRKPALRCKIPILCRVQKGAPAISDSVPGNLLPSPGNRGHKRLR